MTTWDTHGVHKSSGWLLVKVQGADSLRFHLYGLPHKPELCLWVQSGALLAAGEIGQNCPPPNCQLKASHSTKG